MRRQRLFAVTLVGKSILLREGLARILRGANFRILASVSCADDLRPSKSTVHPPLFLIVHTGSDFDFALEQIEFFRSRYPDARIAIVADHYRLNELTSAFRAGANGYFVNVITCDRFIRSVELVMLGETIFPPAFLSFILDSNGPHTVEAAANDQNGEPILVATEDATAPLLSPREKLILRCIIEGDSNKCIARKIDIAEATVKVHVKAILRKIRVQNRTQAAIWGINNGSPTQPEIGKCPPSISDMSKRFADPFKAIAEIKQIEAPIPADMADPNVYHAGVARIERLVRKGRRIPGTT
ncbi:LuxR C-terminal-related transcriptional regulator [Bradyrhizobium sp. TZ2]